MEIGRKLTAALADVHRAGILHRDIKPHNVLLTTFGEPALADFGIATVLDSGLRTSTTASLTPLYSAPEILRGGRATEALPDFGDFTPDGLRFAYYVVFRAHVVFGFVEGMRGVTLRLPPEKVDSLAARGATRVRTRGDDWCFLALYDAVAAHGRRGPGAAASGFSADARGPGGGCRRVGASARQRRVGAGVGACGCVRRCVEG